MNKFFVFPCTIQTGKEGYNGAVLSLACSANVSFMLFFPISEENASLINYLLEKPVEKQTINAGSVLGIYKTMLESWAAGNRFLSGILMDSEYNVETKQEVISVKLIVSDENGSVDSVVKINFIHAMLLAAMDRKEVMVTNELLKKLVPLKNKENDESEEDGETITKNKLPVDKEILDIAKQIMSGKIK